MRREGTFEERTLWSLLRGRRLEGLRFRRQHPIGTDIVDFYCHAARLAVELDGPVHDPVADAKRDHDLGTRGVLVLRFTNAEFLTATEDALDFIVLLAEERIAELAESTSIAKSPSPCPLPEGGGILGSQESCGAALEPHEGEKP